MSKYLKITLLTLIVMFYVTNFSFATNIDMNLSSEDNIITNTNTNTVNTISNSISNTNTSLISSDSTTISSINQSYTDDGLGLSDIINILLIVVGFVIILLGIAILIRLHE